MGYVDKKDVRRKRKRIGKIKLSLERELRPGSAWWSYWPDLNRRPADYESAALPTEPQ